jgi:NAD+ synthase (glutamine-hydrolysing)
LIEVKEGNSFMRITVAQLNPTVGDIRGNLARAKDTIIKAHEEKSDLVVFPELFLVGYPPKDFLEHNGFIRESEKGLERMKVFSALHRDTAFLMGAPFRDQKKSGKGLYNAALFFSDGEMRIAQYKSLLPTYDVFDEARYFNPAVEVHTTSYKGEELGISVCEDAWNDPEQWPEGRMYRTDPIEILVNAGASLLINISASPFHIGKEEVLRMPIAAKFNWRA